jgi:hypothetical protein
MGKKVVDIQESKVEGEFLDITLPKYHHFNVQLISDYYKKTNSRLNTVLEKNNFKIEITFSDKTMLPTQELNQDLGEAFGLGWTPYNRYSNSYSFFTSVNTGDSQAKKDVLTKILNVLNKYEHIYQEQINQSNELVSDKNFNKNDYEFNSEDYTIYFDEKIEKYKFIILNYIDYEEYKKISLFAINKARGINESEIPSHLIKANEKYYAKTIFDVPLHRLNELKKFIEKEEDKHDTYIQEQQSIYDALDKESVEILEENLFNLSIKVDDENKRFVMYCKGMNNTPYQGQIPKKSILGQWAHQCFFTSEKTIDGEVGDFEVKELKNSSYAKKEVFVPLEEIEKIKAIKENYLKSKKYFSHEKSFKFRGNLLTSHAYTTYHLTDYPAFYLSEKDIYLVYSYRSANRNATEEYTSFKGSKVSYQDMVDIMNSVPFADKILINSQELNYFIYKHDTVPQSGLISRDGLQITKKEFFDNLQEKKLLESLTAESIEEKPKKKMKI